MSTLVKLLVVLLLILLTNLATFVFLNWRFRQEVRGEQRLREAQSQRLQELEAELATTTAELDRLAIWSHFIQLQQELAGVDGDIERLNFGDALRRLEEMAEGIEAGRYGETLQEQRGALLRPLESAQQALQRTQVPPARRALAELNERAFAAVSGVAHPADLPTPEEPAPRPPAPPPQPLDPPDEEADEEPRAPEVEPPSASTHQASARHREAPA
jgi:hypothetical protein